MKERIEQHYIENFDKLVKRYNRRAGGVMNAEDVVQEGYARALKYADSYLTSLPFDTWIGTIMNNALKDMKAAEYPRSPPVEDVGDDPYVREQVQDIVTAIGKYKQPKKDILRLWYILGYSREDIRKILNVSKKEIHTTVFWFRKKMREK